MTRNFDVFFDLHLHKRLSKQSWCWWFETPSRPLWRHCNDIELRFCPIHAKLLMPHFKFELSSTKLPKLLFQWPRPINSSQTSIFQCAGNECLIDDGYRCTFFHLIQSGLDNCYGNDKHSVGCNKEGDINSFKCGNQSWSSLCPQMA